MIYMIALADAKNFLPLMQRHDTFEKSERYKAAAHDWFGEIKLIPTSTPCRHRALAMKKDL